MVCLLPALRYGHNSESLHPSLNGSSPRLFWASPPPVSGWGPAHGYSWNGCRWHFVYMPNPPHLLFFTSNEMGSIPVHSGSAALDILFSQKMRRILLRHLFCNTSSTWHIPVVTLQDPATYSSTISTLLLKMRIFVFLLIFIVFRMFFRAANALLILVLISASVLAPRYVNSVTSSMSRSPSLLFDNCFALF